MVLELKLDTAYFNFITRGDPPVLYTEPEGIDWEKSTFVLNDTCLCVQISNEYAEAFRCFYNNDNFQLVLTEDTEDEKVTNVVGRITFNTSEKTWQKLQKHIAQTKRDLERVKDRAVEE